MRTPLILIAALLAPTFANAQLRPVNDLKALFNAAQSAGTETELRADIADRLGFGPHALPIKDLVIRKDGVQHAVNAFVVSGKQYLLFDSHLYAPEVYIFVRDIDGALIAGIHGEQYQPITRTTDMAPSDAILVVDTEEAFWLKWLADGAKAPAPVS